MQTISLLTLIGKPVAGIKAQVINPKYLSEQNNIYPKTRVLKSIRTYFERGKEWVELSWNAENGDTCNFTGCTIESDCCHIQLV